MSPTITQQQLGPHPVTSQEHYQTDAEMAYASTVANKSRTRSFTRAIASRFHNKDHLNSLSARSDKSVKLDDTDAPPDLPSEAMRQDSRPPLSVAGRSTTQGTMTDPKQTHCTRAAHSNPKCQHPLPIYTAFARRLPEQPRILA